MILYMKTTTDKYELPIFVADSMKELSAKLGIKVESVHTMMSRGINGYHRIVVEDMEE